MPGRRERSFIQIAIRRAQALTLYASSRDLDPGAVDSLHHDSLIVVSDRSDVLVAPAHDVLEDWAILRWLDDEYAVHEGAAEPLAMAIGRFPPSGERTGSVGRRTR